MKDEHFKRYWEKAEKDYADAKWRTLIEVPFHRPDGALIWLIETKTPMSDYPGHYLGWWTPANNIAYEYLAYLRQQVDQSEKYSQGAYFIDDYKDDFKPEELLALGLE